MRTAGSVRPSSKGEIVVKYAISFDPSCDGEGNLVPKLWRSHWREKLLASDGVPVPQTDTGG